MNPAIQGAEYNINVLGKDGDDTLIWEGGSPVIAQSNVLQIGNANGTGTYNMKNIKGAFYGIDRRYRNERNWALKSILGVQIKFNDQGGGAGVITADDLWGMKIQSFTSARPYIATTATGLYIGKYTGAVNSYGIVLDGDGAGADIVLGAGKEIKLYGQSGDFVIDNDGNVIVKNLPTSDPSISGALYQENGFVKVSQ